MLDTSVEICALALNEIINAFKGAKDLDIRHIFSEKADRVTNTFVINGKSFAVSNLTHGYADETDRKRKIRRYAALSLYKALSNYLGVTLPWGALTGVRPTKLAYDSIEKTGEFYDFFVSDMKVSEEKAMLTKEVLEGQKGIYSKDENNTDLFVFIPFCPTRCKYCSFISQDLKSARKLVDKYIDVLCEEIEQSRKFIKNLRSVYVGGGTPVSLSDEQLKRVLSALSFVKKGTEFTVEAGRPDCITESNLKLLSDYGVTRICINPQTFNDKTLELIGRKHTAGQTIEKYNLAKDRFSVNMDLIAGLEGETANDFKYSIDKAISLSPDDITVHTLCVKKGSYIAEEGCSADDKEVEKMVAYAHEALHKAGYKPYYLYRQKYMAGCLENTGYAKEGKACVYNVDVMEETTRIVACGANAISKEVKAGGKTILRAGAPKDVATYIEKAAEIIKEKERIFSW